MEGDKKRFEQKHNQILQEMLSRPENKICADCGEKNPRWASANLGCFICLVCAGIHRRMGTDISRVKSVNLDSWTPEQIEHFRTRGNNYVNNQFDPTPEKHSPCPKGDEFALEQWIRDKYERKKFMNLGGPQQSTQVPTQSTDSQVFSALLHSLENMGFKDKQKNIEALKMANGEIEKAVKILVSSNTAAQPRTTQVQQTPAKQTQPLSQPQVQQQTPAKQITPQKQAQADLLGLFDPSSGSSQTATSTGNFGDFAPPPAAPFSHQTSLPTSFPSAPPAAPFSRQASFPNTYSQPPAMPLAPSPSTQTVNANILSLYAANPQARPGYPAQPNYGYGAQPGYGYGAQPTYGYGAPQGYAQPGYGYRPQPGYGYN